MEKERKIFEVCKLVAKDLLGQQKIYAESDIESIKCKCLHKSNTEEIVFLAGILNRLIEERNAKLQAQRTRLDNLKFSNTWLDSALWSGINIPFRKIEKLIADNPGMEAYGIYHIFLCKENSHNR